ncbi:MAG: 50S ribosomal protein L3 N(5)-glutamine methyltransferase [Gammaproteobacteria bacterium]
MVRWGATLLNQANCHFGHGVDNAWDEAILLVRHVLQLDDASMAKAADARLLRTERKHIAELFRRRIEERIPTAYLTQEAWFAGFPFYVDERVIIPRSPMAELIESRFSPWLHHMEDPYILDLCTGSGCIAIACALMFPDSQVDAVDISPEALAIAAKNRQTYQLEKQIELIESDLWMQIPPHQQYDLIVSNPPYVDGAAMAELPAEFQHEPRLALAAGEDGLEIVRRILAQAKKYLAPEGVLIVEVGDSAPALVEAYPALPFYWLEFERGGRGCFC